MFDFVFTSGDKQTKTESTVVSVVDAEKKTKETGSDTVTTRATALSCVQTVEEEDPERMFSTKNTRKKVIS
jgi:hypothetical protein